MTKSELVAALRATREQIQALIAAAGTDRMDVPGVSGEYSFKDVIAHLTAYDRALVTWLDEAKAGRVFIDPVVDQPDLDARNAIVYAAHHGRPAADIVQEFTRTDAELDTRTAALSDAALNDAGASAWFVVPRWQSAIPLWQCIANDSYEHRKQHIPDIERWLAAGD